VNVKLGGINVVPSSTELSDPANPTIVIGTPSLITTGIVTFYLSGADTAHPAPGTQDRPSFTSVVANVDTNVAKYVASTRVQKSRQEIITDLKEMCKVRTRQYSFFEN
jgi:eukaryotic translation initiation factor 2C